jgi:hypothetical protein
MHELKAALAFALCGRTCLTLDLRLVVLLALLGLDLERRIPLCFSGGTFSHSTFDKHGQRKEKALHARAKYPLVCGRGNVEGRGEEERSHQHLFPC